MWTLLQLLLFCLIDRSIGAIRSEWTVADHRRTPVPYRPYVHKQQLNEYSPAPSYLNRTRSIEPIVDHYTYGYGSEEDDDNNDYYMELSAGQTERGLFPNIFNLATNAIISANGTCGQRSPESFCKLVEHVYNRQPQCDICDDLNPEKRHPIEYAIDGTDRWWQSPNLAHGLGNEWITITLDLRQQYQVAYVILKAAIAPRPGNWILERSLDGITYKPWQFYATNDEECTRLYGMEAVRGIPKFHKDDEIICTSFYSRLDPLENGEIHTSLVNGRPGIDGPSESLQYYYAIRDISIGGQCICYGHADHCPADPATGQLKCECKHNTTGENCNECLPLYNQKPWRSGTSTDQNACQPCQCFNHADRCKYDLSVDRSRLSLNPDGMYDGGGVCIDCRHFTQGVNCQECKSFYYRPAGVSPYAPDACHPCQCDPTGSLTGDCVKDETHSRDGLVPGSCYCKPGFGGTRCDRCDLGYRNYPVCDPCPCNRAGSANYANCGDTCVCKRNVEGTFCDRCKPGTFNLDEDNPDGCTPCFCFGMTDDCRALDWYRTQIRDLRSWLLTDLEGQKSVMPPNGSTSDIALTLNVREITDRSLFYWKAPSAYTGNLLNSYGGFLSYFIYYVPEYSGDLVYLSDVLLKKKDGKTIMYRSDQEFRERENVSVRIKFHESAHWFDYQTQQRVSKEQFMSVLANVDILMLRSTYHQHQLQASIYGIALDSASSTPTDLSKAKKMHSVEQCQCPNKFVGFSCEDCEIGHRRVSNVLFKGQCELCKCHDHSQTCDPYTGHCLNCQHNTTGARCEHCLQGYYGNPIAGGIDGACRQCACPLLNSKNNFSPTCAAAKFSFSNLADDDYICTACQIGYVGNKCELCADGYFGDPTKPDGICEPCKCSGNIDTAAIGNCDRQTGVCLKCIGNTHGDQCEMCKPEYYGDALRHDCRSCQCNSYGSVSLVCNNRSGECECKPHYVGIKCDRCEEGYGDVENGCPVCNCNITGSYSERCDSSSGQCSCKPGVFGKRCDTCSTGYFGFSTSGCRYCGCNELGSVDRGKCDIVSGQCVCLPHVKGQSCAECEEGYFNITSGQGCQSCECHPEGAISTVCHAHTGECRCKIGVTGRQCDKCAPNHFGLSSSGCKRCPVCPAPGHVCDPVTGECVCPPHTIGSMCDSCALDTWNYHPLKGCEPCNCNSGGAAGPSCHPNTGACTCRDGYTGQKCDQCNHGHYKFPDCRPCLCDVDGTEPSTCVAGKGCSCDEQGQCQCKKNVHGLKCNDCTSSSFSKTPGHPLGCTECFCFNRTNFCLQSSFVWQQISAPPRHAFFNDPRHNHIRQHGVQVFPNQPDTVYSYGTDHNPIYWSLPQSFLGDKTATYNGHLRFEVVNTNGNYLEGPARPDPRFFEYYPMVVLVGNHRVILEHYKSRSEISDLNSYSVRFREDLWKARHYKEVPVTRQLMMTALQNLQAIYIRGTYIERISEAIMSSASIDVGVSENSSFPFNNTALGVELCDCPKTYEGSSCQNPSEGHCRKKKPNYLDSENPLDLVGNSEPCACNGHSKSCDRETCKCSNCQHNTTGDYCDFCAPGYYGDASYGTEEDCKKCACPRLDGSFSATCRAITTNRPGHRGYFCDACSPGYAGEYCESCVDGYFGDPTIPGGSCQQCKCNRDGSLTEICDRNTGQCQCRLGVTGRDCSECRPRHALSGAQCVPCDVGCTRDLMLDVDELERTLASFNSTGLAPVPWGRLSSINNRTAELERQIIDWKTARDHANDTVKDIGSAVRPLSNARQLLKDATYINERLKQSSEKVLKLRESTRDIMGDVDRAYAEGSSLVRLFKEYLISGTWNRTISSVDLSRWLEESEGILVQLRNQSEFLEKRLNRAELEYKRATDLMDDVLKKKFNDTTFKELKHRIDNLTKSLEEARSTVWDGIRQRLNKAESALSVNNKTLLQFQEFVMNSIEMNSTAEDLLNEARDKLEGSTMHVLTAYDEYRVMNVSLLPDIENATMVCESRYNQLANLLPEYEQDLVDPAESYADLLKSNAERMKSTFNVVKGESSLAVKAAEAYKEIETALMNASQAAQRAKDAADNTAKEISDKEFGQDAEKSMQKSADLLREAQALDVSHLRESAKKQTDRIANVENQNKAQLKELQDLSKTTNTFDDHAGKSSMIATEAKSVMLLVNEIDAKNKVFLQSVQDLAKRVSELTSSAGREMQNVTDGVTRKLEEMTEAKRKLQIVNTNTMKNEEKINELNAKLLLLKEKIAMARGKASKIKLALTSRGNAPCSRSFLSPARPSPFNKIHLEYKPHPDVRDATIFLTQTEQSRTKPAEYLAVEMRERRIIFLWNIGGGDQMITNPMRIDTIPEKPSNSWYHIDVERRENSAILNVSLWVNGKISTDVRTISKDSGGDALIFNTVPGKTLISLGVPQSTAGGSSRIARYRLPLENSPMKFFGTIGAISLDGAKLAFWDFVSNTSNCDPSAYIDNSESVGLSKSFMFDDGFARLDDSQYTYDAKASQIQVVFASYSENGLLYFRGNPTDKDFISIELANGHVIFQFYLGGNSHLRLKSKKVYNDGRFHSVTARRQLTNGSLSLNNDDDFETELSPGQLVDLNIRNGDHYIGGVPLSFNKTIWAQYGIHWEGFYGCIVKLSARPNEQLNIVDAKETLRVKPNCIQENERFVLSNRPISFAGAGMFVVNGVQLDPVSVLAFNFRTASTDGLLLYQSSRLNTRRRRDTRGKGFYAIQLVSGRVVARIGQEDGATDATLYSTGTTTYNDGLLHTVVLKRNRDELALFVDDVLGEKSVLKHSDLTVVSRSGQLFLGGVGRETYPTEELSGYYPFSGCISDVFLNSDRVNLLPQKQSNAYLGHCNASLYRPASPGGVLAEEPHQEDNVDHLIASDDGFAPQQIDSGNFQRKKSRLVYEPPVSLDKEKSDRSRVIVYETFTDAPEIPTTTSPDDVTSTEPVTTTTTAPPTTTVPATCISSTYMSPVPAGGMYGITDDTFNRIAVPQPFDTSDMYFWMEFRTNKSNGVLLAWPNKNWLNYFMIQLEDGLVVLRTKTNKTAEVRGSSKSGVDLADGKWHSLSIIKKERQISMEIDSRDNQIIKKAPGKPTLKPKGGLVIGGVPKSLARKSNITFTNFLGCIRGFSVNGEKQNLVGARGQRGVFDCHEQPLDGAFFPGNGYFRFDKATEQYLSTVELEFRSDYQADGLLMVATIPYTQTGYFAIELVNGNIRATVKAHDAVRSGSISRIFTDTPLCDNRWHHVRVEIVGLKFSLEVDKEPALVGNLSKEILSFLVNVPVYFGGVEPSVRVSLQQLQGSFKGCLRNVKLNDKSIDWLSANVRRRAMPHACPFPG